MKNLFNNISQKEKNRILEMHSGKKNVISEQGIDSDSKPYPGTPNVSVDCLLKAGYKLENVGGPMTKEQVYSGVINGKNYQFTKEGYVRIFGFDNDKEKRAKWECDPLSPKGIKIFDIKDAGRTMYY